MAEQQQVTAPFPTPPPFYQHFTKQNLAQLRQVRKEAVIPTSKPQQTSSNPSENTGFDILTLPASLRYLLPPPPPENNQYRSFGVPLDHNAPPPTLADSGIEHLYPTPHQNPQPHLIALGRSLLNTFLSLTGILSQNPELYAEKVETLQTIMYNMHDLINQYRPHQARETLILMMEERVAGMREEMGRIEDARGKVGKLMGELRVGGEGLVKEGGGRGGEPGGKGEERGERRVERQRKAWEALEREIG